MTNKFYKKDAINNVYVENLEVYNINGNVDIFNALYEALGDFKSALNCLESDYYIFYENMTMEEVAQKHIGDIPSYLGKYIDYKVLAHDMRYGGYYETAYGVIYVA